MRRSWILALCACLSQCLAATSWIAPGAVWFNTSGAKIEAHGGGVVQRGDTFYWVGHSSSNETPMVYPSTDLLNRKNMGAQASITGLWRPELAKSNGSFWIFGQQDRYSQSLCPAKFQEVIQQNLRCIFRRNDNSYSDTAMFYVDTTSTWYLLTCVDHNTVQINAINSDGSIGDKVSRLTAGACEAPGLFKADGVYFLVVSGEIEWRVNPK